MKLRELIPYKPYRYKKEFPDVYDISELVEKVCFIIIAKLVHLRAMQIVCAISKNNVLWKCNCFTD